MIIFGNCKTNKRTLGVRGSPPPPTGGADYGRGQRGPWGGGGGGRGGRGLRGRFTVDVKQRGIHIIATINRLFFMLIGKKIAENVFSIKSFIRYYSMIFLEGEMIFFSKLCDSKRI